MTQYVWFQPMLRLGAVQSMLLYGVQPMCHDTYDVSQCNFMMQINQCFCGAFLRWFVGKLNRFEAQKLLQRTENVDGTFLVRRSDKDDVGYVLSGMMSELAVTIYDKGQTVSSSHL